MTNSSNSNASSTSDSSADVTNSSCYSVFQSLIKSLCLQEFPCGVGSWRSPNDKYADNFSSVTTADYGVGFEKMETLMEYLKSGTWDVDTSWSEEARSLQNMAVVEPRKLVGEKGKKLIHRYFRSLRMVDKEIGVIDSGLLHLCNLEKLTLSVNQISKVPSHNLPRKLKVLELCMNQVEGVASLCKNPPPLEHLGLSYNLLQNPEEYKYFTGKYWPYLLSLDLSHNNLDQLVALVDELATLPQLRSLVLQGNPLAMVPGYRGYTLDVLRDLMIFDDVSVTADERHRFKGLARRKENIRNETILNISIETLGGIPMPEELQDAEGRDEFPIVTSHYIVRYSMLGCLDLPQSETPFIKVQPASDTHLPELLDTIEPKLDDTAEHAPEPVEVKVEETTEELQTASSSRAMKFSSEAMAWGKWIDMDYKFEHASTDLRAFRDFLRQGLRMEIFHKKTYSWSVETETTPEATKSKSPKGSAKTKDGKNKAKSAKDKGKKKPAAAEQELRTDPPVYDKIGGCDIPLTFLLEGGNLLDETFHCGGGPMLPIDELIKLQEADKLQLSCLTFNIKRDSVKPPPCVEMGTEQAEEANKVESKKKPRTASASSKGKDKKGEVKEEPVEQQPPPPRPLTLGVKVELKRWTTAVESLGP